MKRLFPLFPMLLFGLGLIAQRPASSEKGVNPIPNLTNSTNSTTRAVVIGISDYQDPAIPDLRFADKDAEALANFLRSPAGGSLTNDQMTLLTNQQATNGQVISALTWLLDESKPGDQAIIYFSGHGDIEAKLLNQLGFLLLWDSPATVYLSGALPVDILRQVVSTLSIEQKTKVFVVVDACRAGKLADNTVIGAQLTNSQLARQFSQEQKILSCQPTEFSIEGEQWGGGRGVFSYYLINGLFGLADGNRDGSVSLFEIGRYLEDHVTAEAAPQSQVPILLGNKTERLATVDAAVLADLLKNKTGQMAVFTATESRGFEDEVLAKVDASVRETYQAFKQAVEEKRFLEPAGNCAEDYYAQLTKVKGLTSLQGIMKRNYAAALQDDAQQVLNKWMKVDLSEYVLSKKTQTAKYQPYPSYLDRAAVLLGEEHYMYSVLKARKYFFEGYLLAMSDRNPNKELGEKALALFRTALKWQPDLPLSYWQMSLVYGYNLRDIDSAEYCLEQGMLLSHSWIIPYIDASTMVFSTGKNSDYIRSYMEKVTKIDSTSAVGWRIWGVYYMMKNQIVDAEKMFLKEIQVDSSLWIGWNDLGWFYNATKRFTEAEPVLKKSIAIDSTNTLPWFLLAWGYSANKRYIEAEYALVKAISADSTVPKIHHDLGLVYIEINKYAEAEEALKKAIQLDSTYTFAYYQLACLFSIQNQVDTAFEYLEKAVKQGTMNYNWMKQDPDLAPLRERTEQWEALKNKYLADEIYYILACEQSQQGEVDQAFETLELSLANGWKNYDWMQQDTSLAPLRERTEQWEALMKKYFPEKGKD